MTETVEEEKSNERTNENKRTKAHVEIRLYR